MDWSVDPADFELDGSLRDICVLQASSHDWNRLLTFLRRGRWNLRFSVDGDNVALPDSFEMILAMRQDHIPNLVIDPSGMYICCHFFSKDEIELDFDPRLFAEFGGDETDSIARIAMISALSDFCEQLGKALDKEVIVTPENQHDVSLWLFSPWEDRWIHRAERCSGS